MQNRFKAAKPLITTNEARKFLGIKSALLTDTQVEDLIDILSLMAKNNLNKKGSN